MKKNLLTFLLALVASLWTLLYADIYSGTCGAVAWKLNTEDSTFVISGEGAMESYYYESHYPWASYRSYMKYIHLHEGLTNIGCMAFSRCPITSIVLPSTLKTMSTYSFSECEYLSSIVIPNSVTYIGGASFHSCYSLKTVVLSENLTAIEGNIFLRCAALEQINIPESISTNTGTCINNDAFNGCYSLTTCTIPDNVTGQIYGAAFYRVPNVVYHGTSGGAPWGARSINGYVDGYLVYNNENKDTLRACSAAFKGDLILEEGVKVIGEYALEECKSLTSISFPSSLTCVRLGLLNGCTNLQSITCYALLPPQVPVSYHDMFKSVDFSIPLYVPEESIDLYKATKDWKNFYNIQPIPNSPTAVENDNCKPSSADKVIKNGQILIHRADKTYTVTGTEIR